MLLRTLGANLLENILAGRGINTARKGQGINRAGEETVRAAGGIVRAGYGNKNNSRKIKKLIFTSVASFNKFWNTQILSKWT